MENRTASPLETDDDLRSSHPRLRLFARLVGLLALCAAPLFLAALCAGRAGSVPAVPTPTYLTCDGNYPLVAVCAGLPGPEERAKNVVLLIGDGMGFNQIHAARVFRNGPDAPLSFETMSHHGTVSTCSVDDVTDSAASATAMATGRKTMNGSVAVQAIPTFMRLENVLDRHHSEKAVGVVSTASVWDATPAAFITHAPLRDQSRRIACEMILTSRPEVVLGGGALAFQFPLPCPGDDLAVDLMRRARELGYLTLDDRADLPAADGSSPRILGLFAPEEMTWESERGDRSPQPRLSEMAGLALRTLERDPRGFFLMIEGARIDHASHETDLKKLLAEMTEFDRTVRLVMDWAENRGDTLVIVTADHETGGMEIAPGDYSRGDLVRIEWTSRVMPGYARHSSQLVPIYATGPGAEMVRPLMDNTEISCLIDRAFGEAPATTAARGTR